MIAICTNRFEALGYMPEGCTVCEIGVRDGLNSASILRRSPPTTLHLIDPWRHQDDEFYTADKTGNADDKIQQDRYESVLSKFSSEIESNKVIVHRKTLAETIDQFPDDYFDWVFVDARHYYEAVYEDLCMIDSKVKANGIIAGHDFTEHSGAAAMNFGVIGAVGAFVKRRNYELLAMSINYPTRAGDNYPAYFISKDPSSSIKAQFLANLFNSDTPLVELPSSLAMAFHYKKGPNGSILPSYNIM